MKENKENVGIRPQFHITGGTGWINDPNGLVVFQGRYHAFYQYYPHDVHWGPMHWGHVVSDDLLHWETLPIALFPGGERDKNGCFSGSAIVWENKLWVMYTGFNENGGGENIRQIQCLASSEDGVHFTKHGVVIGEDNLPEAYCPWDFRDPKVWRHDGAFWCAVAARARGGRGRTLIYRSDDLFSWTFVGDMFGGDCPGSMTECPDYNQKLGLFVCGEQYQPQEGKAHLNIHTTRWYHGLLDYTTGRFAEKARGIVDYGFDFYAPQIFAGADVMIGWLNMWERNVPSEKYGFAGMLTVPRKIELRDGALYQTPVAQGKTAVSAEVKDSFFDMAKTGVIRIKAKNLRALTLQLRKKGDDCALLTLGDNEWVFDRSKASETINGAEKDADSLNGIRRMPISGDEEIELTIVLDEFSIEIFEGGRALSSTVYPELDADGIALTVDADSCSYQRDIVE